MFSHKHEAQTYLAEQADGGVIVELGSAAGDGIAAFQRGNSKGRLLPIYAVDPYEDFTDGLGAHYDTTNKPRFLEQTAPFSRFVTLLETTAEEAAEDWDLPVSLLWMDLSMTFEPLKCIFQLWKEHVIPDGVVGITGFEYEELGTQALAAYAVDTGEFEMIMPNPVVAILRKKPPKRAVFYIASNDDGGRYVREADCSASSVGMHLGLETILFQVGDTNEPTHHIDRKVILPARRSEMWYLDATRYFNFAVKELTKEGYGQLLYLDTDTWVCRDCIDMFHLLNRYSLALGHSPQREYIQSAVGTPVSFSTLQVGVNLFNNCEWTRGLFGEWLDMYEKHADLYGNNDQAALRDVLYRNRWGLNWMTLTPEYCLRFDFGCFVVGHVRILHGRDDSKRELKAVADEINSTWKMRLWKHGLLEE